MLPYILYRLTLFERGESKADKDHAEIDLTWFLEALCQRDMDYLRQHPETPHLYRSGVRYVRPAQVLGDPYELQVLKRVISARDQRDPEVRRVLKTIGEVFGGEQFCDVGIIRRLGGIDCDGLACWRAAELRQMGMPASPYITSRERPDGGTTYHVIVRWPDGSSEDPSLLLGMGGKRRAADRAREITHNEERVRMIRKAKAQGLAPVAAFDARWIDTPVLPGLSAKDPLTLDWEDDLSSAVDVAMGRAA